MTKEEYRKAIDEVIYLCSCIVNDKTPDKKRIDLIDMEHLYKAADKHNLCSIVGYALESAGVFDHTFIQVKAKAIRKVTVMEIDKEILFERFEQEGIWYMPLKGTIIKDLYPSVGMRQMSDYDILFDSKYQEKVRDIFYEMGYYSEHFGHGKHDVYYKQPVSNFEMHTALFGLSSPKELYEYYSSIMHRLIKDNENQYGYHFCSNDLYIYIIAHEYHHYCTGGTGLRSLLDTYVILQKLGDEIDSDYVQTQTDKLRITDFEQKNKQLALDLFSGKELTEEERDMLEYIIFSGTYGNIQNIVTNNVTKYGGGGKGKLKLECSILTD